MTANAMMRIDHAIIKACIIKCMVFQFYYRIILVLVAGVVIPRIFSRLELHESEKNQSHTVKTLNKIIHQANGRTR